jgi:hypothetical protein
MTPAQQLLRGPSLAAAGIGGLGIALPSVDYLAALPVIMASGTAALTQVAVLLMFNVVAFGAHGDSVAGPIYWRRRQP